MSFGGGLRRWFGRDKASPVLDPPGYRLPGRDIPPAPPPAPAHAGSPSVRLMMADGTVEELPQDPDLAARANYLARSMLSPPPPPPPPGP
jgi:hypothetical protein